MSANHQIALRLTRRYNDDCRHLDAHRHLGEVRVLPSRQTYSGNGFDDLGRFVRTVKVSAEVAKRFKSKVIARALTETFSHWGCSHEHDCCGCLLVAAAVQKISNRRWLVRESIGRNF